ncbi:MAG: hypothetical protein NC331_16780 [Lachnospiraceae bacterium]|nr:hypothetical protein [Lachnospiraceae bacterium]MCM1241004.1 hypothetical protein [Lachnospiraceae bacterium]
MRKSVNSIIWTLALVLYFIISFVTYAWEVTWVIFPMALCAQSIVRLIFSLREEENHI